MKNLLSIVFLLVSVSVVAEEPLLQATRASLADVQSAKVNRFASRAGYRIQAVVQYGNACEVGAHSRTVFAQYLDDRSVLHLTVLDAWDTDIVCTRLAQPVSVPVDLGTYFPPALSSSAPGFGIFTEITVNGLPIDLN